MFGNRDFFICHYLHISKNTCTFAPSFENREINIINRRKAQNFKNMKKTMAIETANYQMEFSYSKFWTKVKELANEAGRKIVYQALLLYYVFVAPDVPYQQKLTILGALGYLICPLDLIPDFIPVVGYSDDLAALAAAIAVVQSSITPAIKEQAQNKVDSIFN